MKYYIGLDAHSRTCTGVVVNEKGEQKFRQTFPTSEGNLIGFLKGIAGEKVLTFEEGNLAQWLYVTLREHVDELLVCNPVFIAKRRGAKTDYLDALHLAQELRTGHLKPVYHDESKWIELRILVNNYLGLIHEIVRVKNRLKAVFRSEAIDTNYNKFYEDKSRTQNLSTETARFVSSQLFDQIERLEKFKLEYALFQKERKKVSSD